MDRSDRLDRQISTYNVLDQRTPALISQKVEKSRKKKKYIERKKVEVRTGREGKENMRLRLLVDSIKVWD